MEDNKLTVRYTYISIEDWENQRDKLQEIIVKDTGKDVWIETRSLPPIGLPPPLTIKAIDALKTLPGVNLHMIEDQ